jgi:hypothetical protein
MEAGSDLDEALYEDTFAAVETAPHVLPELMSGEIVAAVEPPTVHAQGRYLGPDPLAASGYVDALPVDAIGRGCTKPC